MPLDLSVIAAHEAFIAGRAGGCRAYFRFQDLTGTSLMKRKLDGIEFIGCDLSESNFALTSLVTASFYCSSLKRADLRGADLSRADLRGAILRGADLYRANLDGADFRKAVLYKDERDAEFKHNDWLIDAEGDGRDGAVDFRDCTLRGARLSSAKLKGADFSGAMLDGAKLNQADLRDANFEGAVLTGADLNGTRLDGANLENVVRDPADEALTRAEELQKKARAERSVHAISRRTGTARQLRRRRLARSRSGFSSKRADRRQSARGLRRGPRLFRRFAHRRRLFGL